MRTSLWASGRRLLGFAAATAAVSCTPHFAGEYDGEAVLTPSPATMALFDAPSKKVPVHVSIGPSSFELKGSPFAKCAPKVVEVSRRGMILEFTGGLCQIAAKGQGQTAAFGTGAGIATLEGDKFELIFNGTVGSDGLTVTATRSK